MCSILIAMDVLSVKRALLIYTFANKLKIIVHLKGRVVGERGAGDTGANASLPYKKVDSG